MNDICIINADGSEELLYKPSDKQALFHQCTAANALFWGGRGSGKALRLSTPVPTPSGMSSMGDLKVGDQVLDESGSICNVVWKSEPHVDKLGTYKVTFDDGSVIVAGGGHEWLTMTAYERKKATKRTEAYKQNRKLTRKDVGNSPESDGRGRWARRNPLNPPVGEVRTTVELLETLREFRFTGYGLGENNHSIALASAWQLPEQTLPIAPYLLGVWLGDGTSRCGQITGEDDQIFDEITKLGRQVNKLNSKLRYSVVGLTTELRKLGVLKNKHVPQVYLYSSPEQRLALLQGLMDTDGTINATGSCTFTNTNYQLVESVRLLVASLGIKPTQILEKVAKLYGRAIGPVYAVSWTSTLLTFKLQRKLDRLPTKTRSTTLRRYITSITKVDDEVLQCIEVDSPSHLYLVGHSGIPTHNSMALRWEAHARALAHPGFNYVILRRTYPELQRSHLVHIPREMHKLGGTFNQTEHIATYPNGSKGFFSHCATDEHALNLLSAEFAWLGVDELSTFEWEMFTKLAASVRVPVNSGLIAMVRAATNPLGPSAQKILEYFVDKNVDLDEDPDYNPNDWFSIHANLDDNPHLDRAQYKKRFSGLPSHVRKAWVDGEFVLENALFSFSPKKDGKPYHVIPELPSIGNSLILKQV